MIKPTVPEKNGNSDSATKSGFKKAHRKIWRAAKKRSGSRRRFPATTLEEALRVPMAIKQYNAGNAWTPKEVANALGVSFSTDRFYYLTASSRDYGLTTGSRETAEIALTDLGRSLVYPTSAEKESTAIRTALFNVEVFKLVFEYYKGQELPDIKYLSNTLETQFSLPPDLHEAFYAFYTANCLFLKKAGGSDTTMITQRSDDGRAIVVGEPREKTKLKAFVVIPFKERTPVFPTGFFEEVLKNLVTPAGVEAGFQVETARREGSDIIQSTIVNELLDADLVIADLTEHNPNVLFELGLRIAFEKPIALIKAEGTAAIFDVDAMLRVASYNPSLWKSSLEIDVPKIAAHVRGAWEARENPQTWLSMLKKV